MNNNSDILTKKSLIIYLAEDDLEDKELFHDALLEIPLSTKVSHFENGVDLMDALFSELPLPDVIFLDLRMPLMDGFECLTDIRSFVQFRDITIIVYSTSHHKREVNQLKRDGANKYLQKPNSFDQLKALLYKSLLPLHSGGRNVTSSNFVILT